MEPLVGAVAQSSGAADKFAVAGKSGVAELKLRVARERLVSPAG